MNTKDYLIGRISEVENDLIVLRATLSAYEKAEKSLTTVKTTKQLEIPEIPEIGKTYSGTWIENILIVIKVPTRIRITRTVRITTRITRR